MATTARLTRSTLARQSIGWQVKAASISKRGSHRDGNQDFTFAEDDAGIFGVADGVGGHAGGAEASELLCASLMGELLEADRVAVTDLDSAHKVIQRAVDAATEGMRELSRVCPTLSRMGTTVVFGWIVNGDFYYGHVGDSRLYLFRNNRLTQLTRDHSLVEELYSAGVISQSVCKTHPWRNILSRSVGASSRDARADVRQMQIREGDRLLFLTDGITDVLTDDAVRRAASAAVSPQELCRWLVGAAKNNQSADDMSCVVIDILKPFGPRN